jgi:hypothetical protein
MICGPTSIERFDHIDQMHGGRIHELLGFLISSEEDGGNGVNTQRKKRADDVILNPRAHVDEASPPVLDTRPPATQTTWNSSWKAPPRPVASRTGNSTTDTLMHFLLYARYTDTTIIIINVLKHTCISSMFTCYTTEKIHVKTSIHSNFIKNFGKKNNSINKKKYAFEPNTLNPIPFPPLERILVNPHALRGKVCNY